MDELLGEFENLKISALSKSKSLNNYIHNVTLGPNSSKVATIQKKVPNIDNNDNKKVNNVCKTNSNNKRTSFGKILTEIEAQVKDEVATSVKNRLEKFQNASKALDTRIKSDWVHKQKMLIAQSQEQEDLMLKVLEEHDRKAIDHLQQLQIQQQKQAQERNRRNLELQFKEKIRTDLIIIFQNIQKQQQQFRIQYQDILALLKESTISLQDPKKHAIISQISTKLKALVENMEKIKDVCKAQSSELAKSLNNDQLSQFQTVSKANLEIAAYLVSESNKLKETLQYLLKSWKEDEKQRLKQQEQQLATTVVETAQMKQPEPQQLPEKPEKEKIIKNPVTTVDSFASKDALKKYASLQIFLENYHKSFEDLVNDPNMKQFRFHCQKAVNIPLNAISSVNSSHMLDKYTRLANLLRGVPVESGGTVVTSSTHPQGIAFCTDLLARKFVLQGDLLISSQPDSAHGYASVLLALWLDFPDFGQLCLAHFFKTAPYLVPLYPPRVEGQTDREYYESLGYKYTDGVVERQDKFLKRMAGTMRLYAALMVGKGRKNQQGRHPHGLGEAWRWLSNVLNMEPRSDITAALLFEFLEVTGSTLQYAYRNQFQKVLNYINDIYLDKMQKIDSGGPVTRLCVFLQKIKKANGQIEPPKGRFSDNFW